MNMNMNMSISKALADRFLWETMRMVWFLVSLMAVYILFVSWKVCAFPAETLGVARMIPEMVEHLLAACAVSLGIGVLFEYMSNH